MTIGIPYFAYMMSILSDNINIVILKSGKMLEFKLKRGLPAYMGTVTFVSIGLFFIVCLPLFLFMYMEGWDFVDSLYFMMISLSTIGFGDYVLGDKKIFEKQAYVPEISHSLARNLNKNSMRQN